MNDIGSLYTRIEADTSGLNKAEGKIKSFAQRSEKSFDQTSKATKSLESSIGSLTRNIAVLSGGFLAAEGVISGFFAEIRNGLKAVEDFNVTVASSAAFMATFSEKASLGDMVGGYRDSLKYAEQLAYQLEMIDSKTIASGKDLQVISETMLQQGVLLDINNKKQVDGFTNIATALALVTAGQNKDIQMRQEINALLMGQISASNRLPKLLQAIDPQIEEHIKLWKMEGTTIENVGDLLKGFSADTGTLEGLWTTIGSTMQTIHTRILRGAFRPIFSDLIGLAKEFNSTLMDSTGKLTPIAESIQKNTISFYDSAKGLAKEYGGELIALTSALVMVKGAQLAFNLVTKANPYILGATALIYLIEKISGYNITTKDAIEITGNFARSISGMLAVANGKISFFEYATAGAKELDILLNDEVKKIDQAIEKIKNRKEPWSLFPDPSETKRRAEEDQALIEKLTKAREEAVAKTKSSVDAEAKAVQMAKKLEGEALQKLTEDYEKHASRINEINDQIKQNQMSGQELLRDLGRTNMDDFSAWKDMKAEAEEYEQAAIKALQAAQVEKDSKVQATLFEDAITYAEKAQDKFVDLNREVKNGDQTMVSSSQATAEAIAGVERLIALRDEALRANKQVEVSAANSIVEQSGGKIGAMFAEVEAKSTDLVMNKFPAVEEGWGRIWINGQLVAEETFAATSKSLDQIGVKLKEVGSIEATQGVNQEIIKIGETYTTAFTQAQDSSGKASVKMVGDVKEVTKEGEGVKAVWKDVFSEAEKASDSARRKMIEDINAVKKAASNIEYSVGGSVGRRFGGPIQKLKNGGEAIKASVGRFFSGYGGGDRIPILGEAGEFMLRKEAVRAGGKDTASAFNRGDWGKVVSNLSKKLQLGGPVSPVFPAMALAGGGSVSNFHGTGESSRSYYIQGEIEPITVRATDREADRLYYQLNRKYKRRSS